MLPVFWHIGSTPPAVGSGGAKLLWFDTTTNTLKMFDSGVWNSLAPATGGGGSDPWTYVKLASDFTTSLATAQNSLLLFTPAANLNYEFEAVLMIRTATATVNPRVGLAWPIGLTDGVAEIRESQTATTLLSTYGNINAALLSAVGGLPNATQSWPVFIRGMLISGISPSGSLVVQLASETAATNVTIKAGSFIKYRSY